jgi:aerobic carbon-monoxide dehydrogenase medium subunit
LYPASFEYFAPTTLDEALEILERYGDEAKVLAGGMSLIPVLKLRIARPSVLVDINRIEGLDGLNANGGLCIGALVRHKTMEKTDRLKGKWGALGDAAPQIADPVVRNLGTVAGSLVHADPQGDWGSVMLAVRGELVTRSGDGERTIPIDELMLGPFMTTLQPGEIVTEVRVPDPGERAGGTYLKLERKVGDFATAGVAVHIAMDNGNVGQAGIGLTGVGATNLRAEAAEQALVGHALTGDVIDEAARLAGEAADPQDDIRGTAEFKRNAIRVLTARGLRKVAQQLSASGGGGAPYQKPDSDLKPQERRDDVPIPENAPEEFSGSETIEDVMEEIEEKDQ